jgi:hypothetical protein
MPTVTALAMPTAEPTQPAVTPTPNATAAIPTEKSYYGGFLRIEYVDKELETLINPDKSTISPELFKKLFEACLTTTANNGIFDPNLKPEPFSNKIFQARIGSDETGKPDYEVDIGIMSDTKIDPSKGMILRVKELPEVNAPNKAWDIALRDYNMGPINIPAVLGVTKDGTLVANVAISQKQVELFRSKSAGDNYKYVVDWLASYLASGAQNKGFANYVLMTETTGGLNLQGIRDIYKYLNFR